MPYTWKRNHKCEQPSTIAFVDTETLELPHATDQNTSCLTFRLAVLKIGTWDGSTYNGVRTAYLHRPHQFWETIAEHARPRKPVWVYAHNILFDLWILGFPELVDNGQFKLTIGTVKSARKDMAKESLRNRFLGQCSLDKGATIIKGVYRGKRINFIDTCNYFRGSVDSIGQSIGLHKQPMPSACDGEKSWYAYCLRDVEIIETAVCELMREWRANDLGNWQPTIASLAFSAYRHRFMSRPIVCHGDTDATSVERDAYFDGRTQPFYLGRIGHQADLFPSGTGQGLCTNEGSIDGPAYSVDINSLYPSVMRGNDYPVEAVADSAGRPIIWQPPSLEWLDDQIKEYLCVAMVGLSTDVDWYPYRSPNGTIYPVGNFYTTLCTPEFSLARNSGHIKTCQAVILYHKHDIFTTWIDYWWGRKRDAEQHSNPVRREVCKTLLNSLGGKFAQRERYWRNTIRFPVDKPWTSWPARDTQRNQIVSLRGIGQCCQMLCDSGLARHALVSTAAHINSYARVRMHHDRQKLPEKSLIYLANDGLIVTQSGIDCLRAENTIDTGELGHYRTEGVYETAEIFGPRDYQVGHKVKKAGLPKIREEVSPRKWRVKSFECANSLISRPPDGSVHLYESTMSGAAHCFGQYQEKSGWLKPIRLAQW